MCVCMCRTVFTNLHPERERERGRGGDKGGRGRDGRREDEGAYGSLFHRYVKININYIMMIKPRHISSTV